mmetsp:Transcript_27329/g.90848  ORF Transcript_27329/g.90848 Transcript_27329/m.90848 type:complete len:212 (+) Transcript_27329:358-993(+)
MRIVPRERGVAAPPASVPRGPGLPQPELPRGPAALRRGVALSRGAIEASDFRLGPLLGGRLGPLLDGRRMDAEAAALANAAPEVSSRGSQAEMTPRAAAAAAAEGRAAATERRGPDAEAGVVEAGRGTSNARNLPLPTMPCGFGANGCRIDPATAPTLACAPPGPGARSGAPKVRAKARRSVPSKTGMLISMSSSVCRNMSAMPLITFMVL